MDAIHKCRHAISWKHLGLAHVDPPALPCSPNNATTQIGLGSKSVVAFDTAKKGTARGVYKWVEVFLEPQYCSKSWLYVPVFTHYFKKINWRKITNEERNILLFLIFFWEDLLVWFWLAANKNKPSTFNTAVCYFRTCRSWLLSRYYWEVISRMYWTLHLCHFPILLKLILLSGSW